MRRGRVQQPPGVAVPRVLEGRQLDPPLHGFRVPIARVAAAQAAVAELRLEDSRVEPVAAGSAP